MIVLSHYNNLLDPNLLTDGTTAFISGVQRQRRERERGYNTHHIKLVCLIRSIHGSESLRKTIDCKHTKKQRIKGLAKRCSWMCSQSEAQP